MTPTPALVPADRSTPTATPAITPDQLELVRTTIAKGATDDELKLFLFDCQRQGVHPLDRLLHFTKRGGRYTPIVGIDFMRQRAAATGECAGIDDAVFAGEPKSPSFSATVTTYRLVQGQRCAFTATARWAEYRPEQNDFMWQRMPFTMLGKCAEALALRRGFPQQLAGLYATEELDQAERRPLDCDPVTGEVLAADRSAASTAAAPLTKGYPDTQTISPAQRTRLFAIAREHGWTTDQLKAHLLMKYSLRRTSDLLIARYDTVCKDLAGGPPAVAAVTTPPADADQPF
jgi:phage recombination protein Bet